VRELTVSTGAGLPTVQRALRILVEQGFIFTNGRHGTHVVEHPPHRCRFGLVMSERPGADGRYARRLSQAVAEAAGMLAGLLVMDLDRCDTWLGPALAGIPLIAAPEPGLHINGRLILD